MRWLATSCGVDGLGAMEVALGWEREVPEEVSMCVAASAGVSDWVGASSWILLSSGSDEVSG